MIGPIPTGALASADISAVIHQGLTIRLRDGRMGRLAIVDEAGQIVDDTPEVAKEAWFVSIAAYKNFLIGKGHLRVRSGPVPQIGSSEWTAGQPR